MRKLIVILIVFTAIFPAFSQEIETGIVSKLERREYISKIIGTHNDSIFVLKKRKSTFSQNSLAVNYFNQRLNPIGSRLVLLPNSSNENTAKDVFLLNGTTYTYYHSHNKINKLVSAEIINNRTQEKYNLAELSYEKSGNKPQFKLDIDSSNLLLVALPPVDKNENQSFQVKYFDKNLSFKFS